MGDEERLTELRAVYPFVDFFNIISSMLYIFYCYGVFLEPVALILTVCFDSQAINMYAFNWLLLRSHKLCCKYSATHCGWNNTDIWLNEPSLIIF